MDWNMLDDVAESDEAETNGLLTLARQCSRVATGNPVVFTLAPPECSMEIRYGYGTSGEGIAGPVRVGDPLTLVISMRSQYG